MIYCRPMDIFDIQYINAKPNKKCIFFFSEVLFYGETDQITLREQQFNTKAEPNLRLVSHH